MIKNTNSKILLSCFLASALEIYDFVIFVFFASIIEKQYLSFLKPDISLIVTYLLFAIGFLFRPLGSLIFGYIGDTRGRQKALVLSISMMGVGSLVMFLLPPYETIGVASCYILVLVRIIQGISVGGEFTGALIFAVEHSKGKVGLVGGILSASGAFGILLATLVSTLLKNPSLPDYAWRFAFLLGTSLSVVGYVIRKKLTETPVFLSVKKNVKKIPLLEGIKTNKLSFFTTIFIAAANGCGMYFGSIYLPNYLKQNANLDVTSISYLIPLMVVIFCPISGYISDKFSKIKMLLTSCLLMAFYLPFMLQSNINHPNIYLFLISIFIYCIIFSVIASMSNLLATSLFPAQFRMSCTSFSYSLGMGLIGGTVPSVASIITKIYGPNPLYISAYLSLIFLLTSIALIINILPNFKFRLKSS